MIVTLDMSIPKLDEVRKGCEVQTNAMSVQTLQPTKRKDRLRVAAYCRVSTLMEDQSSSIQIQREHFEAEIDAHTDWENAGIFYERISGTSKENRPELEWLLQKCRCRQVDLILTKSISRFARNAADLLWLVRELNSMGIHIVFEKESIDTRTKQGELMLSLLASFAENEVRSISQNNRWAIQRRFENGSYKHSSAPFGYTLEEGKWIIENREAQVVRFIFREYLAGRRSGDIAKELNAGGICTKRSTQKWVRAAISGFWTRDTIISIIRNEAYIGNITLQKTYMDEYYHRKRNCGKYQLIRWVNHHASIVDNSTYDRAQVLRAQRGERWKRTPYLNHCVFTRRVICGECNSSFWRATIRQKGEPRLFWRCANKTVGGSRCGMTNILESSLQNAFLTLLNKLHYAPLLIRIFISDLTHECGSELFAVNEQIACAKSLLCAVEQWVGGKDWRKEAENIFKEHIDRVIVMPNSILCFRFKCGLFFMECVGNSRNIPSQELVPQGGLNGDLRI
ncbi:MAG: recombinase family protein [Clostridia bacterium]|nr:recombinase family protein [Clostridia bacterium]